MNTEILTKMDNLPSRLQLMAENHLSLDRNPVFSFRLPVSYAAKINSCNDPLYRQAFPDSAERHSAKMESNDPLLEHEHMPTPGLIHRYKDRVLVLLTDHCDMHCRHCFRRSFSGSGLGTLSNEHLKAAADYAAARPQIHEIVFSGGDPLTLPPQILEQAFEAFTIPGRSLVYRIGTRVPVVSPWRLNRQLFKVLERIKPLWIMLQTNHPGEIDSATVAAIAKMQKAGLTILNQTVLLKGVNDSVEVLKKLCYCLIENNVKPYYIFQGDLASGTAHFRVSVKKAWKLMKELRREISGIAMPVYAVDLPNGGGKIPLTENYFLREEKDMLVFASPDGGEYKYPVE
jgi:lysine 2,3-aminomutase